MFALPIRLVLEWKASMTLFSRSCQEPANELFSVVNNPTYLHIMINPAIQETQMQFGNESSATASRLPPTVHMTSS